MGAGPRGRRDDGRRPLTLSIPPLDPALPGLCIAQPALAEPFLLEGERVRFVGSQTRSGGQALFRDAGGSAGMTAGIRPDALGHAANLVLYPGVSRRDFTGSRGSAVESVVAARTLPFLAWQLSGSAADECPHPPGPGDSESFAGRRGARRWIGPDGGWPGAPPPDHPCAS